MEPEGAWEDSLRASRASAASSFRCHSEEAETETWSEALGACEAKDVREWELGTHTSPGPLQSPATLRPSALLLH